MSSPTKRRAADTHSGRSRNDESTRRKGTGDAERGSASKGGDATGKRSPAPAAQRGKGG
jgi:hypothetical protein